MGDQRGGAIWTLGEDRFDVVVPDDNQEIGGLTLPARSLTCWQNSSAQRST